MKTIMRDLFSQPLENCVDQSSVDSNGFIRIRSTVVQHCQLHKLHLIVLDADDHTRCTVLDEWGHAMEAKGVIPNTYENEQEGTYILLLYKAKWVPTESVLSKYETNLLKLFHVSWFFVLRDYLNGDDFKSITKQVREERAKGIQVYPRPEQMFRVFKESNFNQIKAVMLLQDPYNNGVANGIPAAVDPGIPKPQTLLKMEHCIGRPIEDTMFSMVRRQGLLMLNTAWTVEHLIPNSHITFWEPFTTEIMSILSGIKKQRVFVLAGKNAQSFKGLIASRHIIVTCEHPVKAAYEKRDWDDNGAIETLNGYYRDEFNTTLRW